MLNRDMKMILNWVIFICYHKKAFYNWLLFNKVPAVMSGNSKGAIKSKKAKLA